MSDQSWNQSWRQSVLFPPLPVTELCKGPCCGDASEGNSERTLKTNPKKTTHQAHKKNNNNHTTFGDWVGWGNEVSWRILRVWFRETEFSDEETDKVSPGGTPTSLLRDSKWGLTVRDEKHLEVYRIYFAASTLKSGTSLHFKTLHDSILKAPLFLVLNQYFTMSTHTLWRVNFALHRSEASLAGTPWRRNIILFFPFPEVFSSFSLPLW